MRMTGSLSNRPCQCRSLLVKAFHREDNQDRGYHLEGERGLAFGQVSPVLTLNLALLPLYTSKADLQYTSALAMHM